MNHRFGIGVLCAAATLLAALPASAACSLKTQPLKVKMEGLRPILSAKINGHEGRFLLDSGAVINSLNGHFAATLKLKPATIAETGTLLGVAADVRIQGAAGADTLNGVVKAEKFEFDGASFKDVSFMATDRVTGVDGLLGQAFLKSVDVEYDLGGGMVRLAKAEGCNGVNMAYWAKDGAVYSVIPLEWVDRDDPHTEAAIYINGVRLRAAFDTGAGWSFITESAAARAGVKTGEAGVVPIGRAQGVDADFQSWVGTFSSIKIGDEEIQNAPMMIGRSGADFDVLIGADFFLSHHLYVANSQGKIFFTYSGGPVFRAPRPQVVAAQKTEGK